MTLTNEQNSFDVGHVNCQFCSEFSGSTDNAFAVLYENVIRDRSVLMTENFRVFPSIGQIVEGYILIAPVRHYSALQTLPTNLTTELNSLYEQVKKALASCYGPCIFYEHGTGSAVSGGCGIYHAHLHAVPLPRSLDPVELLKSKFSYKRIEGLSDLRDQSQGMSGYIFYQDSNSRSYLFDTPNLVSQYMRRTLAAVLGRDDWDWRAAGREERLMGTLSRLSTHFNGVRFSAGPLVNEAHS